jgi:hypothetical protein
MYVCDQLCNKILNTKFKRDKVETQLREKLLQSSRTHDIYYSKNKTSYKASYKVVALTYPM